MRKIVEVCEEAPALFIHGERCDECGKGYFPEYYSGAIAEILPPCPNPEEDEEDTQESDSIQ